MTLLHYCSTCKEYTLQVECPQCHTKTIQKQPPRFSPQDNYGRYRRLFKKQQKGEC
ncbi:MAG: RNA-protein complex protein Nop10 [Thermoplasmatota archaeon]